MKALIMLTLPMNATEVETLSQSGSPPQVVWQGAAHFGAMVCDIAPPSCAKSGRIRADTGGSRTIRNPMRRVLAILVTLTTFVLVEPASAHLNFVEGDVAVVGIWTQDPPGPVSFALVPLVDLHLGDVVGLTDRGWRADERFRPGETQAVYVVSGILQAGTVVTETSLDLGPSADQVFVYWGRIEAAGSLVGTHIFGLNLGGPWVLDATSVATSALPSTLTAGQVALGRFRNCAYAGPLTGTKATLVAEIGDPARWVCSDTTQPAFPTGFMVLRDRGDACFMNEHCMTGICAFGVCCNSDCRQDEPGHCGTCDFGPSDPRTGTCGPAPSFYLCRASSGPCDPMGLCDGVSIECPPDEVSCCSEADCDGGRPDADVGEDGGSADAAAGKTDARPILDAPESGGELGGGGCSCEVGAHGPAQGSIWTILMTLLLMLFRRRGSTPGVVHATRREPRRRFDETSC